jgi:hypothetical protein
MGNTVDAACMASNSVGKELKHLAVYNNGDLYDQLRLVSELLHANSSCFNSVSASL